MGLRNRYKKRLIVACTIAIFFYFSYKKILLNYVNHDTNLVSKGGREYPFMVFLYIHFANYSTNCGGTILSPNIILTAAHCLQNKNSRAEDVIIVFGIDNLEDSSARTNRESNNFILHKDFNDITYDNDIALIFVVQDIPIDTDKTNIVMRGPDKLNGGFYQVLGWASLNKTEGLSNNLLVKAVKIMDHNSCCQYLAKLSKFNQGKLCTLSEYGPCHGDSGGPLLIKSFQIGIVSSGDKDCNKSFPVVFTDINYYKDWIRENAVGYFKKHVEGQFL